MKYYILAIATGFALGFTACKKPEIESRAVERPITIQALVPQKVYTNNIIALDAGSTETSNGRRTLNFEWSCIKYPNGHPPFIISPSAANTKADSIISGQYLFRLKVRDAMGNQATAEYPVEVLPDTLQGAPKIIPLPDQEIQLPLNNVYLDASANYSVNPVGRPLYFNWKLIEKPSGSAEVTIYSATSADTYVSVSKPGMYRFILELNNELGLNNTDTVAVTVLADPLSGTERIYENLTWALVDDGWGPSFHLFIFIKEQDIFRYRNNQNTMVETWDEEKKEWISSDMYEWYGGEDGLIINNYDDYELYMGKKVRVRVRFL